MAVQETVFYPPRGDVSLGSGDDRETIVTDATNSATTNVAVLTHRTTGTPSAGIGTGLVFETEDGGGADQNIAIVRAVLTTVTAASEVGAVRFAIVSAGSVPAEGSEQFAFTAAGTLGIGTTSPITSAAVHVAKSNTGVNLVFVSNANTGTTVQSGFRAGNSAASVDNDYFGLTKFGTGFSAVQTLTPAGGLLELNPGSATTADLVITNIGTNADNDIVFGTGSTRTARVTITNGGNLVMAAGGFILDTVSATVTAGTTQTQAGATALTSSLNIITVCANANDGVKLPAAAAGRLVRVANLGAQNLQIWPPSGDAIDGGAVDAVDANVLAANAERTYVAYDATTYLTFSS